VHRLESQLGVRLLARGARGVTLTASAMRLVDQFEAIVRQVSGLRASERQAELTVAAPSFLAAAFLPAIASALPSYRTRGIELPPALVRAYAAENTYDLALTIGAESFPETWEQSRVGAIRKALFATPALARRLGRPPVAPDKLVDVPFVVPIYSHNGRFVVADEGCPIGNKRRLGHEVQTVSLGLELAAETNQLVFAPAIVATPLVERGALVEVAVRGWAVSEDLYIACNGERMLARARSTVIAAVRAKLTALR
jgi:DNA-binding transcriptional LysR family regulator